MNSSKPSLTTIILTHTRIELLKRALRSLEGQDSVQIHLIIMIDDCFLTSRFMETLPTFGSPIRSLRWFYFKRGLNEFSGPKRVATLRNLALPKIETEWCSYLDDDNELEPEHFSTLFESVMRYRSPATHSWRSIWTKSGRPFKIRGRHPWSNDKDLATRLFVQYRDAGIYQTGSNIIRDKVVPLSRNESMVDMSEWFFSTEFIRGIGFVEDYSLEDRISSRTEDSKLLDEIVKRNIKIPSTQKPTLRYYMGGYSNDWSNEASQIEAWL